MVLAGEPSRAVPCTDVRSGGEDPARAPVAQGRTRAHSHRGPEAQKHSRGPGTRTYLGEHLDLRPTSRHTWKRPQLPCPSGTSHKRMGPALPQLLRKPASQVGCLWERNYFHLLLNLQPSSRERTRVHRLRSALVRPLRSEGARGCSCESPPRSPGAVAMHTGRGERHFLREV